MGGGVPSKHVRAPRTCPHRRSAITNIILHFASFQGTFLEHFNRYGQGAVELQDNWHMVPHMMSVDSSMQTTV
jgi:hypothetical protein